MPFLLKSALQDRNVKCEIVQIGRRHVSPTVAATLHI